MDSDYRRQWLSAASERFSTRVFNAEPIDENDEAALLECEALLRAMYGEVRIAYKSLIGQEENPFDTFGGKIEGAAGIAAVFCKKDAEHERQKVGMAGERFVLECTARGLKTCWVCGSYNHASALHLFEHNDSEELYAVIAIGESQAEPSEKHTEKVPFDELFEIQPGVPDAEVIERAARFAASSAPSSMNRQPWRFEADEKGILLSLRQRSLIANKMQYIDLGIAAAHLEIYLKEHDIPGEWIFLEDENLCYAFT